LTSCKPVSFSRRALLYGVSKYVYNKGLPEECEKEGNVSCRYFLCLKKIVKSVLSSVTYSPNHRQAGAQTINIQSALRPSPDLCKNVSLLCYLVTTVIHTQSVRCQMCVCVHNSEVRHPRCVFKPYGEVNSVKNTTINIWLNGGVYWQ